MKVLGLSFYYHDSAACLVVDGLPRSMAQEERFSRIKNDSSFPKLAIEFVLKESGVAMDELDAIVFYEKPFIKFDRIFRTSLTTFPWGLKVFRESIKHFFLDKLWIRQLVVNKLGVNQDNVFFSEHHLSHAASTFFCSPWDEAGLLTVDGVGEWSTTALGACKGNEISIHKEEHFPHSLGLLYSAFTAFLGFKVNEGEYKVMGMAPYGRPTYADKVRKLVTVLPDGSYQLNLEYFKFHRSTHKSYSKKFVELFGKPRDPASKFFTRATGWPSYFGPRPESAEYDRIAEEQEYYADLAASLQMVFEELMIGLANEVHRLTGSDRLCLGGGVALNSVANKKILDRTPFKEIYIQPAAGDAGGALGAALAFEYMGNGTERRGFVMDQAYYGQKFTSSEIQNFLTESGIAFEVENDEDALLDRIANDIANGKVIGYFHGSFEWGPRALGHRSILADPRSTDMKDIVNTKIKFREPYRPFAPSVLAEHAHEYFDISDVDVHYPTRFMLYVTQVKEGKGREIPAITHVDNSARLQTVYRDVSPRYWKLINAFYQRTGVPMVLNTSFNLKGEPIVATPQNAVNTFMKSGMDALILENCIVYRSGLPAEFVSEKE